MDFNPAYKNRIKRFFRFFLKYTYPTLYRLELKHTHLDYIQSKTIGSKISPKANISGPAQINASEIGDYTYISINSRILSTKIGKFCSIGPNFFCGWGVHPTDALSTSPAFYSLKKQAGITFSKTDKVIENLPIEIGNDVFIGMNVTVLDGVKIGDGAIIGAGAIVSKDIPPYAVAVGSPIQIIKYRFAPPIIEKLLKIKWWNFEEKDLQDVEAFLFDIETFITKYDQH
jgi:virginiamycin A acetyltransferase